MKKLVQFVKNRAGIGGYVIGAKKRLELISGHLGFINYDKEGYRIVDFFHIRKELFPCVTIPERGTDKG